MEKLIFLQFSLVKVSTHKINLLFFIKMDASFQSCFRVPLASFWSKAQGRIRVSPNGTQTHSFLYKIESSVKIAGKKINVDGSRTAFYSKYHFLSSFLWSIVVPQGNKRDHLMVLELWRSLIQPTMRSFCFDGHMDKVRTPLEHPLKSSNHEFCTAAHETTELSKPYSS